MIPYLRRRRKTGASRIEWPIQVPSDPVPAGAERSISVSEIYKESILATTCLTPPATGCSKSGIQCVDVSKKVVLMPTATVGTISTSCQGSPTVTCTTNAEGTATTVTLTQRVCVSIPVTFGVTKEDGDASIMCAGTDLE